MNNPPKQQSLITFTVLDELDNRVRRVTLNSETYVSALDILEHYGNICGIITYAS